MSQLHSAALRFLKRRNRLLEELARPVARVLEVGLEVCEGRFGEQTGVQNDENALLEQDFGGCEERRGRREQSRAKRRDEKLRGRERAKRKRREGRADREAEASRRR